MPSEELKDFNLKKRLQRAELALLSSDLETADSIYNEILENWEMYEKALKEREMEAMECLALIAHIEKLLEEKRKEVLDQFEATKARRAYALLSIK